MQRRALWKGQTARAEAERDVSGKARVPTMGMDPWAVTSETGFADHLVQ